ncbi:MAG: TetR/AcrR family transcriptional regulator [Pseudomonadota bacterium]
MTAARRAFAENGFDAASVRDIAADVDMTHTLIRYHFGSKEQLWKDVVTDMFQRLDTALSEDVIGQVDFATREGLTIFLRHYIRYCADNPEHARIMIGESLHGGERLKWMIQFIRESHVALVPIFKQLVKTGVIPEVWLISLFYSISAVCQMPFVISNAIHELYGVDMHTDAAIDAHAETVIAILLNVPERRPESWPALPEWARG